MKHDAHPALGTTAGVLDTSFGATDADGVNGAASTDFYSSVNVGSDDKG